MIRWRGLFLEDLGRKALALGLAAGLWWLVQGEIEDYDRKLFVVVPAAEVATLAPDRKDRIEIAVPEGWVLVEPAAGSSVELTFFGPASLRHQFFGTGVPARYEPRVPPPPAILHRETIQATDLQWVRGDEAAELLRGVSASRNEIALTLERCAEAAVNLEPRFAPVRGAPAAGYEARPDVLCFEPNQVRVQGPHRALEELRAALAAEPESAPPLLTAIELDGKVRADRVVELALDEALRQRGVRMVPERVRAVLPVRLRERARVRWLVFPSEIHLAGAAPSGRWSLAPAPPRPWIAELADLAELDFAFDESWLRAHVLFYVPLGALPPGAERQARLRLEWDIHGVEPQERKALLERALRLRPEAGGEQDWFVDLVPAD